MAQQGRFIVFEGLDGTGKTTQLQMLRDHLHRQHPDREIVCTREPTPGPVGQLIRRALQPEDPLGEDVLPYLFAADRRDHLNRIIEPAATRGAIVLCDRYMLSSYAYQAASVGLDRVLQLNADFPYPGLTLMFDLSPTVCAARLAARTGLPLERFETLTHLQAIADRYAKGLAAYRGRVEHINAAGSVEEVHARVLDIVGD